MALVFKTFFAWALLSVAFSAFSTPVSAQANTTTCNLILNVGSFIEGTTDIKPVEGVSVTLINVKDGQRVIANQVTDLYENLSSGEYKVTASRAGYRTTKDTITLDCTYTIQGLAEHTVPMWEGDPARSVNYTKIIHISDKGAAVGKVIEIGPADKPGKAELDNAAFSKGVVNGSALVLAKPKYPPTARAVGASGPVNVQVLIDEEGYVIASEAVNGHPLLKGVSVLAAKASKFMPTLLSGTPVKVSGIIVYNFQQRVSR